MYVYIPKLKSQKIVTAGQFFCCKKVYVFCFKNNYVYLLSSMTILEVQWNLQVSKPNEQFNNTKRLTLN